jgi:hypothetical protein
LSTVPRSPASSRASVEDETLAARCAATTCLITAAVAIDVEVVQESLSETLAQLQGTGESLEAVASSPGPTIILHDSIAAGTFSERLFYRLNISHAVVPGCFATRDMLNAETPTTAASQAAIVTSPKYVPNSLRHGRRRRTPEPHHQHRGR